jgi:hypothetical protein
MDIQLPLEHRYNSPSIRDKIAWNVTRVYCTRNLNSPLNVRKIKLREKSHNGKKISLKKKADHLQYWINRV